MRRDLKSREQFQSQKKKSKFRHCCRFIGCLLFVVALLGAGAICLWLFLPEDQKAELANELIDADEPDFVFNKCGASAGDNCCNGLETICDLRADEIMYAGIHNAHASLEDGFYIAPNHDLSLEKGLQAGFRAINIDLGKCGGELKLIHGRCQLGSRDPVEALANIASFLDSNPTEIVIINIQGTQSEGEDPVTLNELEELVNSVAGIKERLYWHEDRLAPWPTLRELRDSRKQVLFFYYKIGEDVCHNAGNCPEGIHDWFIYAKETEFAFDTVGELEDRAISCAITRGAESAVFFAVNGFLSIPNRVAAVDVNALPFLQEHIPACSRLNDGMDVNVVYVDFWSKGDLPLYVQRRNSIRANR